VGNVLNILILCDYHLPGANANTLADHINSFQKFSKHNIFLLSNIGDLPLDFRIDLFDVIVIHYSIVIFNDNYLSKSAKDYISKFKGLKVLFIQDEYREINLVQNAIDHLGINLLFSCTPRSLWKYIYPEHILPWLELRSTMTGYVPEALAQHIVKPISERSIDVFYRGRKLPYWIGSVTKEKYDIAQKFSYLASGTDLVVDLASDESARIYGDDWLKHLANAKCTLGVESAASILDFTGGIQRRTETYTQNNPQASFEEVEKEIFPGIDSRFNTAQISPRCFEAAAMRTCMILYEGSYSGVLIAGRHYLSLKKNFSNFKEIYNAIRDPKLLQEISDNAYREIVLNPFYSYKSFVEEFDKIIVEIIDQRKIVIQQKFNNLFQEFLKINPQFKPQIGRLHGPLYFSNRIQNEFFISHAFTTHCLIKDELSFNYKSIIYVRDIVSESQFNINLFSKLKKGLFLRIIFLFWRYIPYKFRNKIKALFLILFK
jgi:hypothetical protein